MEEQFQPVAGYEGRYEVSNLGRVKSLVTDKMLRPGRNSSGYLSVSLFDGSSPRKPKSQLVHILVARAFIGPRPVGYHVDHKDGDKLNNAAANLHYVTPQQNVDRQLLTGTRPKVYRGEKHVNAKLTHSQVIALRKMHEEGKTFAELGRLFNVSPFTAKNVVTRTTYACVK